MDAIFDWCVQVLVYFAGVFGITYKEILTLVLVIWLIVQRVRICRLQGLLEEKGREP